MSGPESSSQHLDLPLSGLTLDFEILVDLALAILIPIATFYVFGWLTKALREVGIVNRRPAVNRILDILTFALPIFIFLFCVTLVAENSTFVSLLFLVVISIVGSAAAIEPLRGILGALIIYARGDIKVGDQIQVAELKGRVSRMGPMNILIETTSGSCIAIPNQHIVKQTYEVHVKGGGPLLTVDVPGDIDPEKVRKLAYMCPYRRDNSEVGIEQQNESLQVSIEVRNMNLKPWVQQYFKNFLSQRNNRHRY